MLTAERVREILSYDPLTGVFVWMARASAKFNGKFAGKVAGSIDDMGYRVIGVDGRLYRAHRLAWLYVHGEWPKIIDHKDGDRDNNTIANLRLATALQNTANRRGDSRSGYKGVTWQSQIGRWQARIRVKGKNIHLGVFGTAEEASKAYETAAKSVHGEFANFGKL